jgi:glycogen debranching enzyme
MNPSRLSALPIDIAPVPAVDDPESTREDPTAQDMRRMRSFLALDDEDAPTVGIDDDYADEKTVVPESVELVAMREEVVRLRNTLQRVGAEMEEGMREIARAHDMRRKAEDEAAAQRRRADLAEDRQRTLDVQVAILGAFARAPWYTRLFGRPAIPDLLG